mgnify:CR=1 FL=1
MLTKLSNLSTSTDVLDYDVIAFSETWLHEGILRGELGMENFTIFRCDRSKLTSSNERGGGVLIAVRSNISCKEVQ